MLEITNLTLEELKKVLNGIVDNLHYEDEVSFSVIWEKCSHSNQVTKHIEIAVSKNVKIDEEG